MKQLKSPYRFVKKYYRDYRDSYPYQVKLFNYQWFTRHVPDHWLYKFIVERNLIRDYKKDICIFSVNGSKFAIKLNRSKIKIFYTAENVHVPYSSWIKYQDLLLDNSRIVLSLGFDYINHEQYIRFPLWLMYMFDPNDTYQSIKNKCQALTSPNIQNEERTKFCSFVCRYDYFGNRLDMYNLINSIDKIDCDGLFMNNNNDLKTIYNDNKREYLKNYKFNLCPENSDYEGYVTEKIFEAIYSGCIPIYWGSSNNPEPEILNQNAILFIEDNDNTKLKNTVSQINTNSKLYRDFISQNRLTAHAPDFIYEIFQKLETRLSNIINS